MCLGGRGGGHLRGRVGGSTSGLHLPEPWSHHSGPAVSGLSGLEDTPESGLGGELSGLGDRESGLGGRE